MKRIIPVAALALFGAVTLTACGEGTKEMSADKSAYDAAVAEAKAEQKKAASMDYEWRDIGKILKKADKEAAKGDYAAAMKNVKMATFQAKMGQQQAKEEAGIGNPAYLTN